jgi:hypothetical protein
MSKTAKQIESSIKAWGTRGTRWVKDGQEIALDVLVHFSEHADVRMVNALYKAMPKGTKTSSMSQWLLTFGGVKANTGKNKSDLPFLMLKDEKGERVLPDIAGGTETPWYELGVEKEPDEVLDIMALVKAVLRKAEKAAESGTQLKNGDMLATLRRLTDPLPAADAAELEAALKAPAPF